MAAVQRSDAVMEALTYLCGHLGADAFWVPDSWPSNPESAGIFPLDQFEPCLVLHTQYKSDRRLDLEFGGRVYRDRIYSALECAVRYQLFKCG